MTIVRFTSPSHAAHHARAIVLALLLSGATTALAQSGATPAATVNGVAITQMKLQSSLDAYMRQNKIGAGGVFDPGFYNKIRRRVLDVLIAQELLWQEASKRGLVATDEEAKAAVAQVRAQHGSESAFISKIREGGFADEPEYRQDLKQRLSVQQLVMADIAPSISVSDAEIQDFYSANAERFVRPEEIHARHILVKVAKDADEATRQVAQARIEAIHVEAQESGADFAELAKEHSEGPSAPQGGDLGFFGRGRMVKPFEEAAFALEPGAISEPVQTVFGYHIIKVEERRGGEVTSLEEASVQIGEHLRRQKIQDAVAARAQALREAADVEGTAGP